MKIKYLLFLICLLFVEFCIAQNIIPNGNFDESKRCINDSWFEVLKHPYSNLFFCKFWFNPTKASPDYYNRCSKDGNFMIPENDLGTQEANSGDGYVGIGNYNALEESEYIEIKLNQSLKPNTKYCFSLYVNIPDIAVNSTDEIDFSLTNKKISGKKKEYISSENYYRIYYDKIINEKQKWILLYKEVATENYANYLTIGWFNTQIKRSKITNKKIPIQKQNYIGDEIYFYIDDVDLVEINNENDCPCKQIKVGTNLVVQTDTTRNLQEPRIEETVILMNLAFENNKSEILSSSYNELDKLIIYLNSHKNVTIELTGYTDNLGKEEDNLKLSESRAKAVETYLISNEIIKERIRTHGYGSTKPISTNETEEGRKQNRRVEFILHLNQ